jgi:hypothetical protein
MAEKFRSHEAGASIVLDDDEKAVLIHLFSETAQFLAPDDSPDQGPGGSTEPVELDPLAAMVGIGEDAQEPDDPALRRLLPDAYPEDPEASQEFRRFTQDGLRARKLANAISVLESLHTDSKRIVLDQVQAHAWLTSLTDLRLVLADRLGIDDDPASQEWDEDDAENDPRAAMLAVYDWLGYLQETLVRVLSKRLA